MTQDAPYCQATSRLRLFAQEVDAEPWKQDHEDAMACFAFEETLEFGVQAYDHFVRLDEALRARLVRARAEGLAGSEFMVEGLGVLRRMFEDWTRTARKAEAALLAFEHEGYQVEHAGPFRQRHEEARWVLSPAYEALGHEKMIDLRDRAIDEARAENAT